MAELLFIPKNRPTISNFDCVIQIVSQKIKRRQTELDVELPFHHLTRIF